MLRFLWISNRPAIISEIVATQSTSTTLEISGLGLSIDHERKIKLAVLIMPAATAMGCCDLLNAANIRNTPSSAKFKVPPDR